MDIAAFVSSSLATGETPDQVARALIEDHHVLPISAIKALRSGGNMTLAEAKDVILRHLPAEKWAVAERLWDEIVAHQGTADGEV
jgi:hypothetical protein